MNNNSFLLNLSFNRIILGCAFILLYILLFFGTHFTTIKVLGPLHLFDLILSIVAGITIIIIPLRIPLRLFYYKPILVIVLISVGYLIFSFLNDLHSFEIIIRQYAVFIYLYIAYVIFGPLFNRLNFHIVIKAIKRIILVGLLAQLIYILTLALLGKLSFNEYNYLSPLMVMLTISCASYSIIYYKGILSLIFYLFILLIGLTYNHASVMVPILIIPAAYYFLKQRLIIIKWFFLMVCTISIISVVLIFPGIIDNNVMWRFGYWYFILHDLVINNYLIFGNGFGVPYASPEITYFLQTVQGGTTQLGVGDESYITPPHNSFFTIFFHIGILPGLLIFAPFYKFFKSFRFNNINQDTRFILLILIGLCCWCCFNVVLELPHSSLYFWLIYFLFVYQCKELKRL